MDFVTETLNWVNNVRAEHNIGEPLEALPKGVRADACRCPIAVALMATEVASSYGVEADWWPEEQPMPLPYAAKTFIRQFDDGLLPEFDFNEA